MTVLEEEEIQLPKSRKSDIIFNERPIDILEASKSSPANAEEISENTVWDQIRNGLREELGEAIDAAWLSKAVATEDKETSTLTLTMPTRFMADFLRNNYPHVIRRLSEGCGIKCVEYGYE